jgi:bifunctional non-homologous end joining protein LigD
MAGLRTYRRKRDFTKTVEPEGTTAATKGRGAKRLSGGLFCIQKHAARRLHHDLRLELDGVLVSWAVPKGPSLDPRVPRLAVHVEDHPIEYGDFEGIIPKGEYGGGTVMLWDTGSWEPVGDPRAGLEKGELKFRLAGERLVGGWVLVRTRGSDSDQEDQWLLIKERDEEARPREPDPWGPDDRSVSTGRTMDEITAGGKPHKRRKPAAGGSQAGGGDQADGGGRGAAQRSVSLPSTVTLTLATPAAEPPEGGDWLHEIKYDGYRIAARIRDDVRLFSRNGLDWTHRFPAVSEALAALPASGTWLDGEAVVFDERGVSDFGALQRALKEGRPEDVTYVAFDLLFEDGDDLRGLPLLERKRRLERLLKRGGRGLHGVVRFGDHIEGRGDAVFEEACLQGLEGLVSKRTDGPYAGRRTRSWLKAKCGRRQEFVVGGFTDPSGARTGLGALLLGVHDPEGALRFAGRVGSGFDDATLARLSKRLHGLERRTPPFSDPPRGAQARGVHWTSPSLVAEVTFTEWTGDGQLRHPVFKGLREDKSAAEVVREVETHAPGPSDPEGSRAAHAGGDPVGPGAGAATPRDPVSSGARPAPDSAAPARKPARPTVGGITRPTVGGITISHPERVVFPDPGLTKLDVADYYETVAGLMVPYLARRPLTVIRCPDGIGSQCFFQKNVTPSVPRSVSKVRVRGADGKSIVYPVVDTAEGLLAMVQNGAVEFHVWGSKVGAIETPDILVFDLDPGPDVEWRRVREAARALRAELEDRGLESFLRTSGGKGLHVVAPFTMRARWPHVGAFAREVVEALVAREPARYTATMSKAKRGGKVFVDHFRNGRGATAVTSYSLRGRPGAPVALPIGWDELGRTRGGADWTAARVLRRLHARTADPWADFFETGRRQTLPDAEE